MHTINICQSAAPTKQATCIEGKQISRPPAHVVAVPVMRGEQMAGSISEPNRSGFELSSLLVQNSSTKVAAQQSLESVQAPCEVGSLCVEFIVFAGMFAFSVSSQLNMQDAYEIPLKEDVQCCVQRLDSVQKPRKVGSPVRCAVRAPCFHYRVPTEVKKKKKKQMRHCTLTCTQ